MNPHSELRREKILDEMRQIERMRQGTISEQFYGTGENKQGPYYLLQGYVEGKHWSMRVPRERIEQVREDLRAGVRFKELCQEFAELTEQATLRADAPEGKKTPGSEAGALPGNRSVPEDHPNPVCRYRNPSDGGDRRRLTGGVDARWVSDSGGLLQATRSAMRTSTHRRRPPLLVDDYVPARRPQSCLDRFGELLHTGQNRPACLGVVFELFAFV